MSKRRKPSTLSLGTISEGTLRPEDLIPAYISVVEDLRLTKAERAELTGIKRRVRIYERDDDWTLEQADFDLDELTAIIENHLPDYAYFGSLEGDGACFGIWPSIESLQENAVERQRYLDPNDPRGHDASVLKIDAGDPFPKAKLNSRDSYGRGFDHVMTVTDHGNVTLYRRSGNRWREVWAIV
jgi:hypothetical protein